MSLFPSSFESAAAGPSNSLTSAFTSKASQKNSNKRKRPSVGAHHDAGLLKSTQANLDKLMSKIEKGHVKEKSGTENMGNSSQKKKKIKSNNEGQTAKSAAVTPSKKDKQKQAHVKAAPSGKDQSTPKKGDKRSGDKKTGKSVDNGPVELPIPTIPVTKNKLQVGGEGLTDMQSKMQSKLEGARFRWINEQLYSTPSTEAVEMMKKDPKIFADYHMTHRALTAGWPAPPLQYITKALAPLPARTVIADLGCGDAGLARALVPQGKVVLSYDLVGDSGVPGSGSEDAKKVSEGWVIQADFLEQIPLPGRPGGLTHDTNSAVLAGKKGKKKGGNKDEKASEVVDVAVCCLSLMGKNWVGGIAEVCRILKEGGTFHVAEVTSRFTSTEEFVEKVESFGFKLEEQDSPSTHFTLFRFTKESAVPLGPARGEEGWEDRVYEGEEILKACVYKKR